jgi:hypothetical protein
MIMIMLKLGESLLMCLFLELDCQSSHLLRVGKLVTTRNRFVCSWNFIEWCSPIEFSDHL